MKRVSSFSVRDSTCARLYNRPSERSVVEGFSEDRRPEVEEGSGEVRKLLAVAWTLLWSGTAFGAVYFVDSTGGDDRNDGLRPDRALRSLARVNDLVLRPGDSVLLRRSRTWQGNLIIRARGREGAPLYFGAYGTGEAPALRGSLQIHSWRSEGGRLWSAATPLSKIYRRGLWLDGRPAVWEWKLRELNRDEEFTYRFSEGRLYLFSERDPQERYQRVEPSFSVVVLTEESSWVVLENLRLFGARLGGVSIWKGSNYNTVSNVEAHDCGIGVIVAGEGNTIKGNYIHNLHMVRNTPEVDEQSSYDDFGAVGVWLLNRGNQVLGNRLIGLKAFSYDFGDDGGAVEMHALSPEETVNDNRILRNFARGCDGFLEVGSTSCHSTVVAYNVSVDNGRFTLVYTKGGYRTDVKNFRVEHNTVVDQGAERHWAPVLFGGPGPGEGFLVRNNIFVVYNMRALSNAEQFVHRNNLWYAPELDPSRYGFSLHRSEITAEPGFRLFPVDLHLREDSRAVDAGLFLGWTEDYDGNPVPQGEAPDLGAYEYSGGTALFVRGDVTGNGAVSLTDAFTLMAWLFSNAPAVACPDAADANDDGGVNLADLVRLLSYLLNGEALPPPRGEPGPDPTPDSLSCAPVR